MVRRTLVLLATILTPVAAAAERSVSVRLAGVWSQTEVEAVGLVDGASTFQLQEKVKGLGAQVDLGLPQGFLLGVHYVRHWGNLVPEVSEVLEVGLGANELGLSLEKRFYFLTSANSGPFVGAGAGYGRLSLGDSIGIPGQADFSDVDASIDLYRLYATAGLQLSGPLGVSARAGRSFGSASGDALTLGQTVEVGGRELSLELDYGGLFVTVAVSLLGF